MRKAVLFILLTALPVQMFAQSELYQSTLLTLCDALLTTQNKELSDAHYGALVCPSVNPDNHPLHSRAGEAVYPFAIAWKLTGEPKYRDAAIKLGNWMITTQETSGKKVGGWSEGWPDPEQKGWYGTTTDQLVSMAGAYPILKPFLSAAEVEKWNASMEKAAEFIMQHFPLNANINYEATAAATLVLAYQTLDNPKKIWLEKAESLMNTYTLPFIDQQNLLTGEGMGVDEGYNLAQSIGYIALYAILRNDTLIKQVASNLLRAHYLFVYPNGSVDNSWGTRSFKWSYESGTKTAPGVYFSFALLADMDPKFNAAGIKCLEYLNKSCIKNGWIVYGPHANNHESSSPPCNYSTFARAQSIALAIEYGPKVAKVSPFPAQETNWVKFFPDIKVAVIRTEKIMATVSAYGEIRRYPRSSVCRGGSITNLWYEGFGKNGYLQSSSVSTYQRLEKMHMPVEKDLLPLTPRIEFQKDSNYFSNIFEDQGTMSVKEEKGLTTISTIGRMKTIGGSSSDANYTITHRFFKDYLTKEFTIKGEHLPFSVIEPFINDPGTRFLMKNDSTVVIKPASSQWEWELQVIKSSVPFYIELGKNAEKYWCSFPGVDAYPVTIKVDAASAEVRSLTISIKSVKTVTKN